MGIRKYAAFLLVFLTFLAPGVLAARLPTVGSDTNAWGTLLNEFLAVEHGPNGTHANITATNITISNTLNTSTIVLGNNCADGQILKWSGGVGICGSDSTSGGASTAGGWTNDTISTTTSYSIIADTNTFVMNATTNLVGIGTLSPLSKLHVLGNMTLTGTLFIDGSNVTGNLAANSTYQDNIAAWLASNSTRLDLTIANLLSNSTRIENIATFLQSNSSYQNTISSWLASNSTRIDLAHTLLAANSTRLDLTTANLALNSTAIDLVRTNLASNSTYQNTIASNLASNSTRLDLAHSLLAANSTRLDLAHTWVLANATRLDSIALNLSALNTLVYSKASGSDPLKANQSDLAANSTRVDALDLREAANNASQSAELVSLRTTLASNSTYQNTIAANLLSNSTRLENIATFLGANSSRLDALYLSHSSDNSTLYNFISNKYNISNVDSLLSAKANQTDFAGTASALAANSTRLDSAHALIAANSTYQNTIAGWLASNSTRLDSTALNLSALNTLVYTKGSGADGGGNATSSGTENYTARFSNITHVIAGSIFDNGTTVGIGTASPVFGFEVNTTTAITSLDNATLIIKGNVTDSNSSLRFGEANGIAGVMLRYDGLANRLDIRDISSQGALATFLRGGLRVGIGTTSPTAKLEVNGSILVTGPGIQSDAGDTTHNVDPSLRGAFDFSEGSGTRTYDKVSGAVGTMTNFTLTSVSGWTGEGRHGTGLKFDETKNAGIDVETTSSLNFTNVAAFTIEAWVKPSSRQTANYPMIYMADGSFWMQLASSGLAGGVYCAMVNATGNASNAWPPVGTDFGGLFDDKWHHVACVYDGASITACADGTCANSFSANGPLNVTAKVLIGYYGTGGWFNGTIDSITIYNRSLSTDEIRSHAALSELSGSSYTGSVYLLPRKIPNATDRLQNSSSLALRGQFFNNETGVYSFASSFVYVEAINFTTPIHNIVFQHGSTPSLVMQSTGRVGIGTSRPVATLHLVGNATMTGTLFVDGSNVTGVLAANSTYQDTLASWLAANSTRSDLIASNLLSNSTRIDLAHTLLAANSTRLDLAHAWLLANATRLEDRATNLTNLHTLVYSKGAGDGGGNATAGGGTGFIAKFVNDTHLGNSFIFTDNVSIGIGTTTSLDAKLTVRGTNLSSNLSLNINDTLYVNASSSNVGIGTTSPRRLLHVSGANAGAQLTGLVIENRGATVNTEASLSFNTDTTFFELGRISSLRIDSPNSGDTALLFYTTGLSTLTERLRITSMGNVGIGTTSPSAKLEINGSNTANNLSLNVNNTLYVNASQDRVGIGTTSPSQKLEVVGNINASAYITNGTDYAEMMVKLNEKEILEAGDVVEVIGGKITKSSGTRRTGIYFVVTDTAGVLGNSGKSGIPVAFIGQVKVKVTGRVAEGDYVIPSKDGTAVAVPRSQMTLDKLFDALGKAIESKESSSTSRVLVAVGVK